MKTKALLVVLCVFTVILCACTSPKTSASADTPNTDATPDSPHIPTSPDTPSVPTIPQVSPGDISDDPYISTSPDDAPSRFPYTEMLDSSFSLFSSPSYDSVSMGVVGGKGGEYTIREESIDNEGNLWGKIEDNCWVDLTYARKFAENPPPITANHADRSLLAGEYYEYSSTDGVDGVTLVAFRATEDLKNVQLTSLTWSGSGYEEVNTLYTLDGLKPEKPLVAKLMFLGSATVFGISFEDDDGIVRYFAVNESGRNGEIEIKEYTR